MLLGQHVGAEVPALEDIIAVVLMLLLAEVRVGLHLLLLLLLQLGCFLSLDLLLGATSSALFLLLSALTNRVEILRVIVRRPRLLPLVLVLLEQARRDLHLDRLHLHARPAASSLLDRGQPATLVVHVVLGLVLRAALVRVAQAEQLLALVARQDVLTRRVLSRCVTMLMLLHLLLLKHLPLLSGQALLRQGIIRL